MSKNKLFIGEHEYDFDNSKEKEKLFIRLKELLNVKNVCFLSGNARNRPLVRSYWCDVKA